MKDIRNSRLARTLVKIPYNLADGLLALVTIGLCATALYGSKVSVIFLTLYVLMLLHFVRSWRKAARDERDSHLESLKLLEESVNLLEKLHEPNRYS